MKKSLLILLASALTTFGANAQNPFFAGLEALNGQPLFGSSPFQDSLWGYDMANQSIVYRSAPQLAGFTITGITSITTHPCTEVIYAVAKVSGVTGRVLCTFDPQSDQLTQIGNLGSNVSSISFTSDGTLYGTNGDGAGANPESLFQIDENTGVKTLVGALGNGVDGEVVCYDYDNDRFFHFSGNGTAIMESFPTPLAVPSAITPTAISPGLGTGEIFGAIYWGNDSILLSTISSNLRFVNSAGVVGPALFSTPDDLRGLAMGKRWVSLAGEDTICVNDITTLNAKGGQAYQWTVNGNVIPGATSSSWNPIQTGWYNCIINRDTLNCTTTPADTAWFGKYIVVNELPVVQILPSGFHYLCSTNPSVTLSGDPAGATYQWYNNGVAIVGETNDNYTATAPGQYNLYVTDGNGCSDSLATAVSVMDAPSSTQNPVGTDTICAPNTVTITVTPGADFYQWLNNGTPIGGATSDTYVASATGVYTCEVMYGSCIETTAAFDLFVDPCSGIDEVNADFANLYPNPANDKVQLSTKSSGTYNVNLFANDGQLIESFSFTGNEYTIDIAHLSKGSYMIAVTSEIGTSRKQLIKQ